MSLPFEKESRGGGEGKERVIIMINFDDHVSIYST